MQKLNLDSHHVKHQAKYKFFESEHMLFSRKELSYLQRCYHLTPRELEILKLVCQGLDDNEMARKLKIKYNTVGTHVGNICRRMGVKGKVGIVLGFLEILKKRRD